MELRGWILDVLTCVEKIQEKEFTLAQLYSFENELKHKHPNNCFIKDKIRQQLQYLRKQGLIELISPGRYRKR